MNSWNVVSPISIRGLNGLAKIRVIDTANRGLFASRQFFFKMHSLAIEGFREV